MTAQAGPPLRLVLINNMPDLAFEDTENQFGSLVQEASDLFACRLDFCSLATLRRGDRVKERIREHYVASDELHRRNYDGAIITGTEPQQDDLRAETYWEELAEVLDWAAECTHSTILSCLAAHSAVLHFDGIGRRRQPDKLFGVFDESRLESHALSREIGDSISFPHSRWNSLLPAELSDHGYSILTESDATGTGWFVKPQKRSLFVHFQGHPEYSHSTLLKEYRRDVRRFLRGERDTYPLLPQGYLDETSLEQLTRFGVEAMAAPTEQTLQLFPEIDSLNGLRRDWRPTSIAIYRNWLSYLAEAQHAAADSARSMAAHG
jgi:homoserine O-succinyltransferase/O-acetyltransferase